MKTKKEDKSEYSSEFRAHTEKDWERFRKGDPRSMIVPPSHGWVNDEAQDRQWQERKKDYMKTTLERENQNRAKELAKKKP